jgi:hypothetical protein
MGSTMGPSSQPVAEHGIAGREREEHTGECKKDEVEHGRLQIGRAPVSRGAINVPFVTSLARINGA